MAGKLTFDYGVCKVSELKIGTFLEGRNKNKIEKIELPSGQTVYPTPRFEKSLQMRFRFSDNIYKYIPPAELFERISKVNKNDKIRWCVENTPSGTSKLLSVTNPNSGYIKYDELKELLVTHGAESRGTNYSNGVVRSQHTPSVPTKTEISGEWFENKYIVDCPIDGFGKPNTYLGLLRQVCVNGAVAFCPSFRSPINVGKGEDNIVQSLCRVFNGFNNEEGFSALHQRFSSAANSFASISEVMTLYRLITKLYNQKEFRNVKVLRIGKDEEGDAANYDAVPPLKAFMNVMGELNQAYGLTNLDQLSAKRQKVCPTPAKVYDLLNYASETATYHLLPRGSRAMHAFIGTIVADDYDLEGTCDKHENWRDFFYTDEQTTEALASMDRMF